MRSRTVINLATGILMAQSRCSQSEAFELLAKVSNTRNVKLRIVAEEILRRFDGGSGRNGLQRLRPYRGAPRPASLRMS